MSHDLFMVFANIRCWMLPPEIRGIGLTNETTFPNVSGCILKSIHSITKLIMKTSDVQSNFYRKMISG